MCRVWRDVSYIPSLWRDVDLLYDYTTTSHFVTYTRVEDEYKRIEHSPELIKHKIPLIILLHTKIWGR